MTALRLAAAFAACLGFAAPLLASPEIWRGEWPNTDFSQSSVKFQEILSGGPPKDGIPALDGSKMIPVSAETRLNDAEPVMVLELGRRQAPGLADPLPDLARDRE